MKSAVAAVVVLAAIAAGCGSGEREPATGQLTTSATERADAARSYRMISTERRPEADGSHTETRCEAAVDEARRRVEASCRQLGESDGVTIIGIGETGYLRPAGQSVFAKLEGGNSLGGFSPATLLQKLRSEGARPKRIGEGTVRGDSTVRYSLTVTCEQANLSECHGDKVAMELWVGDDGVIRRIRIRQKQYLTTAEFYDFGAELDIEPPAADQILVPGQDPPREDCPFDLDAGEPISVRLALDTLRAHEFDAGLRENCHGTTVSDITAWLGSGALNCSLFEATPTGVSSSRVTSSSSPRGSDVGPDETRRLANLECGIAVLGSPDRESVDRLSAAFEDLRREVNP